jgi:hypothetical protein
MGSRVLARVYYFVRRALLVADRVASGLFTGVWLGVLGRPTLNRIDDLYYVGGESKRFSPIDYLDDAYQRLGLWGWERDAIERYFRAPARVAVLAAGGGREVLALRKLGFDADGWECQSDFVASANHILVEDGFPPSVSEAPRDSCPAGEASYSGAIVGWGAYTMIQGRRRRVALLEALRARVTDGAPVLLSFFPRTEGDGRFALAARAANVGRRLLRREPAEVGDYLEPNYVHYFTEEEIRSELQEGGFKLLIYEARPYGHAVATACRAAMKPW